MQQSTISVYDVSDDVIDDALMNRLLLLNSNHDNSVYLQYHLHQMQLLRSDGLSYPCRVCCLSCHSDGLGSLQQLQPFLAADSPPPQVNTRIQVDMLTLISSSSSDLVDDSTRSHHCCNTSWYSSVQTTFIE